MKTRARRMPPKKNYPNIVIFPLQEELLLGKPHFDLVKKRDILVPKSWPEFSKKTTSGFISYMRPYIIDHELVRHICVDANDYLLGGKEFLEQYPSGDVPVMRISWIQEPESLIFHSAHAEMVKQYKKWGVL
jgi:hypothetical protein